MSIPQRHHQGISGTYFVTSRTWQSRAFFAKESYCTVLIESLLHYRQEGAFALHACVVMPDHFHILLTASQDKSLERVVQCIKGGSARRLALEFDLRFPVWQRGFSDHRIRDSADFDIHLQYIWDNPVRKKLVSHANEFRASSLSGTFPVDEPPQGLKPQREERAVFSARLKPCPDYFHA
jgi:putative transposase